MLLVCDAKLQGPRQDKEVCGVMQWRSQLRSLETSIDANTKKCVVLWNSCAPLLCNNSPVLQDPRCLARPTGSSGWLAGWADGGRMNKCTQHPHMHIHQTYRIRQTTTVVLHLISQRRGAHPPVCGAALQASRIPYGYSRSHCSDAVCGNPVVVGVWDGHMENGRIEDWRSSVCDYLYTKAGVHTDMASEHSSGGGMLTKIHRLFTAYAA